MLFFLQSQPGPLARYYRPRMENPQCVKGDVREGETQETPDYGTVTPVMWALNELLTSHKAGDFIRRQGHQQALGFRFSGT